MWIIVFGFVKLQVNKKKKCLCLFNVSRSFKHKLKPVHWVRVGVRGSIAMLSPTLISNLHVGKTLCTHSSFSLSNAVFPP